MDYDVLIIGAGMSGLAAGIRLAHFDKKVCILERHHRTGGLNSFYNAGGRKFDVGLHAMTNCVAPGTKARPLTKLLRQLRLKPEDLDLHQQHMSAVQFPEKSIRFTNDPDFFVEEVNNNFPKQTDNFQKLLKTIGEYDELSLDAGPISSRKVLESIITDPLLIDMVLCPLMFYGNAQEHDMDFGQFVIMFKSVFCEGFARPRDGVRHILDLLVKKYRQSGGELRLKCGVNSIQASRNRVQALQLDNGEVLTAGKVMSSAGYLETMKLLSGNGAQAATIAQEGQLSFTECIFVLDRQPTELGLDKTIVFFNNSDRFNYRKPATLMDTTSGVICCPNNFEFETALPEGMVRTTNMANYDLWKALTDNAYTTHKTECRQQSLEEVIKIVPDFRASVVYEDMFTPLTIEKFTGHINGAVYGSPSKIRNGRTHLENLFLCGTDQGFLGIVGAMLSGISMANLHVLKAQ